MKAKKPIIAILGSTSHIAKGLIYNFAQTQGFVLHLYTRSPQKLCSFLSKIDRSPGFEYVLHEDYSHFENHYYDVIINCVGVGTLKKLRGNYTLYFTVIEQYDNLAIDYLKNKQPDALYISLSSGAVYGKGFSEPVREDTVTRIRINHISTEDYYTIVRLYAEAKHRAFESLRIVDLRIFSYFSRFIDLEDGYFISEILDSLLNGKVFRTGAQNIVRDYVHPEDLFSFILKCIDTGKINTAFDIYSKKPVQKEEILEYFSSKYGLVYQLDQSFEYHSATGSKDIYYSTYNNASELGYEPKFSSMDTSQFTIG